MPSNTPMVAFGSGQDSVPHTLLGATVWVRVHGRGGDEQVIITHLGEDDPVEVARHLRAIPGSPRPAKAPGHGWSRPPRQAPRRCG